MRDEAAVIVSGGRSAREQTKKEEAVLFVHTLQRLFITNKSIGRLSLYTTSGLRKSHVIFLLF